MSSVADVVELDEERVRRGSVKDNDNFETVGDMLRAARESRDLTIADVSAATNIREAHIESLEAMDIDRLPVAAYTTGFVKAYAQLLELPVAPLVGRFREEAGYASSTIAPQVSIPQSRDLSGGRELSLLAVVAILAFIIWVAWQVMREPEPDGPVQIAGTPLQERPVDQRDASFGGANEVPMAPVEPNPNPEPVPGMEATGEAEAVATSDLSEPQALEGATLPQMTVEDAAALGEQLADAEETQQPVAADTPQAAAPSAADALTAEVNGLSAETAPDVVDPETSQTFAQEDASDTGAASVEAVEDAGALPQIVGAAAPGTEIEGTEPVAQEVVFTEPTTQSRVSPIYPRRCERLSSGTETVYVTYDINSRGQPVNVRVTRSTNDCFNPAAVSAVSRWSFQPATRNGTPVPVYTRSTRFRFELPQ